MYRNDMNYSPALVAGLTLWMSACSAPGNTEAG